MRLPSVRQNQGVSSLAAVHDAYFLPQVRELWPGFPHAVHFLLLTVFFFAFFFAAMKDLLVVSTFKELPAESA